MLVLLAALDWAIIHQRGLRFCYATSALCRSVSGAIMPIPGGAGTPQYQAQQQLPRARLTGFSDRVGAFYSSWLRPCTLPVCALRVASGGATMTYRSPGRFWLPPHPPARVLLMYVTGRALGVLYIRQVRDPVY